MLSDVVPLIFFPKYAFVHQVPCMWLTASPRMIHPVTSAWFTRLWLCCLPLPSMWQGSRAERGFGVRLSWTWDQRDRSPLPNWYPILSTSPSIVRSYFHLWCHMVMVLYNVGQHALLIAFKQHRCEWPISSFFFFFLFFNLSLISMILLYVQESLAYSEYSSQITQSKPKLQYNCRYSLLGQLKTG